VGERLTTGPLSSSSSPSHLFIFFMGGLTVTTAGTVVFFVLSSSEASQSAMAKPTERMRKQKRKSKREWMEIRSKLSDDFLFAFSPGAISGNCRTSGHNEFNDSRRVTQTRFASRQEPWIYSKCVISCCDVLAIWKPHGSVERCGCRCTIWRGRRGEENTRTRLVGRRKGFTTDIARSRRSHYVDNAHSGPGGCA